MTIYKDAQGNQYRKNNDEWQTLVTGKGWQRYNGTAYLNVTSLGGKQAVIEPAVQSEPDDTVEVSEYEKQKENELFVHFVAAGYSQAVTLDLNPKDLAKTSCDYAQAMIDELKARGRL